MTELLEAPLQYKSRSFIRNLAVYFGPALVGGGRCNDGPGRVSRNCHSAVLTLRGSLDLRNFSLGLRRTVDTRYHPREGPKARICISPLCFNYRIRIPIRNLPDISRHGRDSERLNHTDS